MSRNRNVSKVNIEYFRHQLQKRSDKADEECDDEHTHNCKILKWVQNVCPEDGEGEPPCRPKPKRVLSAPRPLTHLFEEASHRLRPKKRRVAGLLL